VVTVLDSLEVLMCMLHVVMLEVVSGNCLRQF
jgi:hypothetical protein